MIKLELDWAAPDMPDFGPDSAEDDGAMLVVERGQKVGPAGHPTVVVFVTALPGHHEHRASMALVGWLNDHYTAGDWDEADELAGAAQEV
jgi:hypothetical protein